MLYLLPEEGQLCNYYYQ